VILINFNENAETAFGDHFRREKRPDGQRDSGHFSDLRLIRRVGGMWKQPARRPTLSAIGVWNGSAMPPKRAI
jgi:hypothetical protein